MNRTKIEWTDYTWNPITGCKHGCWYCYARKLTQRFKKIFPNGFEPTFHPERLKEPWELKKPSKIFVCSVADLFAPWTPTEWRDAVLQSISECPVKHKFQLLTKNPERIPPIHFPDNVWVGATITEQAEADKIADLSTVDAKIKFVSFEPLLGDISFYMEGIQWAIIGKLTGSKRVKLKKEWVYNLLGQLSAYDIPVFMKFNLCPPFEKSELIQEFPKEVDEIGWVC
jgi:protein gp37